MKLKNRTAFITGSTKGIGLSIAQMMSRAGARVVINGIEEDLADAIADQISQDGGKAMALPGDVSSNRVILQAFERIESEWGPVDILVNNAGIEIRKPCLDYTEEDFYRTINVNLKAAFFLSQRALPNMITRKWGRIINISSIHHSKPKGIGSIYSMSKGGITMMTRELALEYSGYGITINNIAPGAIRTDMNKEVLSDPAYERKVINRIPAGFIGDPYDIAKLATFMASDDARYISGATYYVDGGMVLG